MPTQRESVLQHIQEVYGVPPEVLWPETPDNEIFRHPGSRKWFAVLMAVERRCLGLAGEGAVDVLNVKCDPRMVGSLLAQEGFHPAYHMNKDHWVSILLDDTVPDETLFPLVELSWDSVAPRRKIRKTERNEP